MSSEQNLFPINQNIKKMNTYTLELKEITKSFFGVAALTDVNFNLQKGEVHGLIGENGAGKSTMMNILGGVIQPDNGRMKINNEIYSPEDPQAAIEKGIGFIHQELNLFNNLTVAENMFINRFPVGRATRLINKRKIINITKDVLESLDLDISPHTTVEHLSPGEKQMVEIAKVLVADADILIFDEPTTSLTAKETEKLFNIISQLKAQGKSMIYISHILDDISKISDQITVLRDGVVVDTDQINHFDINRMISSMVGRDLDQIYPEKKASPTGDVLLEVDKISQSGIVKEISFHLKKGEVLGIFGLMGSGRSELARIIFGLDPYDSGSIKIKGKRLKSMNPGNRIKEKIAFVTEDRRQEGLLMEDTLLENISIVALPDFAKSALKVLLKREISASVSNMVAALKIKVASIKKSLAKSLSGGNQQKVVVAKWMMADPSVFIMDEPTRGIDVGAKFEIYSLMDELACKGTGIINISSEAEELIGTCDRIIVMSRGEIVGEFKNKDLDQATILRAAFRQDQVA